MYVVEQFAKVVEEEKFSNELLSVLKVLFNLYAIHGIVENAGDFLEVGLFLLLNSEKQP